MDGYISTAIVIERNYYCSRVKCMTSCAWHPICSNFHLQPIDGTHELPKHKRYVWFIAQRTALHWWDSVGARVYGRWSHLHKVSCSGWNRTMLVSGVHTNDPMARHHVTRVLHEGTYAPGFVLVSRGKCLAITTKVSHVVKHFRFWRIYNQTIIS